MKSFSLVIFLSLILSHVGISSSYGVTPRHAMYEVEQQDFGIQNQGKLGIDSLDTDATLIKVVDELGGGIYDYEVKAVVPFFPSQVRKEWEKYKNEISERIGPISPLLTAGSHLIENSAKTVDDLLADARTMASCFRQKCWQVANETNSIVSFGVNDEALIKSKASLVRKVKKFAKELNVSEEKMLAEIPDALRGTIIVETPEQISLIVDTIKEHFQTKKGETVVFINMWEKNRPSGYVGIHARVSLPIEGKEGGENKSIIAEIQIHLRCVMCWKERESFLYEHVREEKSSELEASASTLMYLTALKDCPKPHIPRYIALHFRSK